MTKIFGSPKGNFSPTGAEDAAKADKAQGAKGQNGPAGAAGGNNRLGFAGRIRMGVSTGMGRARDTIVRATIRSGGMAFSAFSSVKKSLAGAQASALNCLRSCGRHCGGDSDSDSVMDRDDYFDFRGSSSSGSSTSRGSDVSSLSSRSSSSGSVNGDDASDTTSLYSVDSDDGGDTASIYNNDGNDGYEEIGDTYHMPLGRDDETKLSSDRHERKAMDDRHKDLGLNLDSSMFKKEVSDPQGKEKERFNTMKWEPGATEGQAGFLKRNEYDPDTGDLTDVANELHIYHKEDPKNGQPGRVYGVYYGDMEGPDPRGMAKKAIDEGDLKAPPESGKNIEVVGKKVKGLKSALKKPNPEGPSSPKKPGGGKGGIRFDEQVKVTVIENKEDRKTIEDLFGDDNDKAPNGNDDTRM